VKNDFKWTDEQAGIIGANPDARLVVEAGPGTGKTSVACARVASLVEQGVTPSSIMMFSFTRTAVAELRARIKSFTSNPEIAAVRIATLDSQAWFFRYGTGTDFESLTGSFESNIAETIKLLQAGDDVIDEYLESINHLIVDEAQDLTSTRARFVTELVKKLSTRCGITIFADPCQGIYGFTNDLEDSSGDVNNFLESFPFEKENFERRSLLTLHRTSNTTIVKTFRAARTSVVEEGHNPVNVVEAIQKNCSKLKKELNGVIHGEYLVLYRRRVQALMDSQYFPRYHRLRISRLPDCIHPWIGALFAKYTDDTIDRNQFDNLWEMKVDVKSLLFNAIRSDDAWKLLHTHAASRYGSVSLLRLRELLCRTKPHADFLIPEYGMWGPIFSTIHGSKGREAKNVVLMLPRNETTLVVPKDIPNSDRKNLEESRVYYVGATRAKEFLCYGDAKSLKGASSLNSGRVWHSYERGRNAMSKASVQFGIDGDLDETAIVHREFCDSPQSAISNFDELLALHRHFVNEPEDVPPAIDLFLELREVGGETEWRYRLQLGGPYEDSEQVYGWLSDSVGRDLFQIANEMERRTFRSNLRPPTKITGYVNQEEVYQPAIRILGLRTVVVSQEKADQLHEPFRSSRFLVVPIISGFPSVMFQIARR
jgi:hypothetical protein